MQIRCPRLTRLPQTQPADAQAPATVHPPLWALTHRRASRPSCSPAVLTPLPKSTPKCPGGGRQGTPSCCPPPPMKRMDGQEPCLTTAQSSPQCRRVLKNERMRRPGPLADIWITAGQWSRSPSPIASPSLLTHCLSSAPSLSTHYPASPSWPHSTPQTANTASAASLAPPSRLTSWVPGPFQRKGSLPPAWLPLPTVSDLDPPLPSLFPFPSLLPPPSSPFPPLLPSPSSISRLLGD